MEIKLSIEGIITSFRRSRHNVYNNQMIVEPLLSGVNKNEIKSILTRLIGKKVIYNTGKKKIEGVITSSHGNYRLRARFEKGMPGQALGKKVIIK